MAHRLSPAEEVLLRDYVARLLAAAPPGAIAAVRVFGSRARGESGPDSDLDVAVELAPGVAASRFGRIAVDAAWDAMEARDLIALRLSPVVLPAFGPDPTGIEATILREGLRLWPAQ
ncbi:MAG: nucleotidyltransferase domain-containing protein [Acetobacteraceae bacterium]|nr:nucleotidyltransferase domain-containing protein [Acetobacteraceae bacterium]